SDDVPTLEIVVPGGGQLSATKRIPIQVAGPQALRRRAQRRAHGGADQLSWRPTQEAPPRAAFRAGFGPAAGYLQGAWRIERKAWSLAAPTAGSGRLPLVIGARWTWRPPGATAAVPAKARARTWPATA